MSRQIAPGTERALRKLFLALFLRGRGARGLKKDSAPGSIASKLWLALGMNALIGGVFAASLAMTPVFMMSLFMHAITFMMLGMFVAASAGEVLFNKEESEILMHRPVTPEALLRAKILVMLQVSAWIAGALNLVTFGVGILGRNGTWAYLPAHFVSTMLSALFSIGLVVTTYQLGLKWIGRERLDNILTTVQVILSISFFVGIQVLPRVIGRMPNATALTVEAWWMLLVPPAWFAGVDELLLGHASQSTITLALIGFTATAGLIYLATVTLAASFGHGLQRIQDVSAPTEHGQKRRLPALVRQPPLSWWLRDPVSRASFLLVTAYMLRDREIKLRLYPALAPVMVFPLIMLVGTGSRGTTGSDFALAFSSVYLCVVPMSAINLLEFSQQWQASDVFRVAPISGPARILHGTRRAVLLMLTLPMFIGIALISFAMSRDPGLWPLLIPGLIALPVFAMLACLVGQPVPLSRPTEEAKSAGRGAAQILLMMGAGVMGFITHAAWKANHLWMLILIESAIALGAYIMCRQLVNDASWRPIS